jgi:transposase InsO family protein
MPELPDLETYVEALKECVRGEPVLSVKLGFSTLEFEMEATGLSSARRDAEPELFAFIERYYNARRLHSTNGYRSSNRAEADSRCQALAA